MIMLDGEESINRLTCTFNNDTLERKYKKVKLEKNKNYIWNLMLLGHLIFLLVILDDLKQLGIQTIYVSVHIIASVIVYFLLLYEKYREEYYENYFTFVIPILMANGAYHYYMNNLNEVDAALEKGAEKARKIANEVLDRVRTKLGY